MDRKSTGVRSIWRAQAIGRALTVLAATQGVGAIAQAQDGGAVPGAQPSIYTCVDPRGRRITADRPIPECLGSEQRELTPRGNLRRTLPPTLTEGERAREAQQRQEATARQAQLETERRRNHALLVRYPNQAAHDQQRSGTLAQLDELIATVREREGELAREQQAINAELAPYQNDPARTPLWLRSKQQENERQRVAQADYLADQLRERERVSTRFDAELQRLRGLWKQEGR